MLYSLYYVSNQSHNYHLHILRVCVSQSLNLKLILEQWLLFSVDVKFAWQKIVRLVFWQQVAYGRCLPTNIYIQFFELMISCSYLQVTQRNISDLGKSVILFLRSVANSLDFSFVPCVGHSEKCSQTDHFYVCTQKLLPVSNFDH